MNIAEAAYVARQPRWWHTAEQIAEGTKIVIDALVTGKLAECSACNGTGHVERTVRDVYQGLVQVTAECRACYGRGLIIPGVTW